MIHLNKLSVRKNGQSICGVPHLEIAAGEHWAIVGANGSGKTTLLRVLAGLETGFDGRCDISCQRRERVFVHQSPFLLRGTVLDNVTYGPRAHGLSRTAYEPDALQWLQQLGLEDRAGEHANHLSGGERRRVALARAMILRPQLLLLDEPLADLDQAGTDQVVAALGLLPDTTIVIASPNALPAGLTTCEYRMTKEASCV